MILVTYDYCIIFDTHLIQSNNSQSKLDERRGEEPKSLAL